MLRCCMHSDPNFGREVSPLSNRYGYFLNEENRKEFGVLDKLDVRDAIQAELENCDYRQIMAVLNPDLTEFEDFDDVIELAARMSDPLDVVELTGVLKEEFTAFPVAVKEHYGNDYEVFARDIIGGGFADFVAEKYGFKQGSQSVADDSNASGVGDKKADDGNGGVRTVDDALAVTRRQLDEVKQQLADLTGGQQK